MAVRAESMAEPLPGYRLIERLGGGGFGEVWKAEAPGGLFKAIKFVYGDLEAADEEGARAGQEFKALKRVISVRHPFILSLERFDVIDGQLIIVTELADKTLWDRFRECRAEGLQGIPREELLHYLSDTAEALDLMNTEYQLQHLDIKPQNLFLVHNHVKVADFGLVKDLEGMLASVTGGVTPVYAAPETFEGKVSRFSDQYSLAIVYQELLTGHRPYPGTTLRQLVMQHCQGTPDLKSLPADDRPIVLHALAKNHEERFPSCQVFVDALRTAGQLPVRTVAPAPMRAQSAPAEASPKEGSNDGEKTQSNQRPVARPQTGGESPSISPRDPVIDLSPSTSHRAFDTPDDMAVECMTPPPIHREPALEGKADGVLVPGLVIGLGTLGLATLRQLRKETFASYGFSEALPSLRLLYIDTDPQVADSATRGRDQIALHKNEVLLTRLHRPSHYRPRGAGSGLEAWFPAKMVYRIPRQQTAAGIRALGRLAFVDYYKTIARRLEIELEACCSKETLEKAIRESGLQLRSPVPRVYIVTSLADGTGSGMFVDLAYLVRQKLLEMGQVGGEVVGLCLLPPTDKGSRRAPELANTFAALSELNHFSNKHVIFSAQYEMGEVRPGAKQFSWKGPPLDRCVFFTLPEGHEATLSDDSEGTMGLTPGAAITLTRAARVIFSDFTTPLGRAADDYRKGAAEPGSLKEGAGARPQADGSFVPLYQTAGIYRLVWPRRLLLDQAARIVCRRVVERWMSKNAKPFAEAVKQWVEERWEQCGFTAEQLICRYQQAGEAALGQPPETAFQTVHNAVVAALAPKNAKNSETPVNIAVVMEAMEQMEQLVGVPEECRPPSRPGQPVTYEPGLLEPILQEIGDKVVDQFEQKLAEMAVSLIEDPNYRLAGSEEALRQLRAQVEQALETHENLAQEFTERAASIYKRIRTLSESHSQATQATTWKPPFSRRGANGSSAGGDLIELLRTYPKCRYQSLILQRITTLYVSLRGLLSDQLREVDYCRARLTDLLNMFSDSDEAKATRTESPSAGRFLAGNGYKSVDEAVAKLAGGVNATELVELDITLQGIIRSQFKALVHVCMTSASVLKTLAPALQKATRSFLRSRLGDTNVVDIYLKQFADTPESGGGRLEDDLCEVFESASPEVVALPPRSEMNWLAVPCGPNEQSLRDVVARALGDKPVLPATSTDEIAIYRENTLACLADLDQMGPCAQEAYGRVTGQEHTTPHSRCDITEWATRNGGG